MINYSSHFDVQQNFKLFDSQLFYTIINWHKRIDRVRQAWYVLIPFLLVFIFILWSTWRGCRGIKCYTFNRFSQCFLIRRFLPSRIANSHTFKFLISFHPLLQRFFLIFILPYTTFYTTGVIIFVILCFPLREFPLQARKIIKKKL